MTTLTRVLRGMRSEIPVPGAIRAASARLRERRTTLAVGALFGLGGVPALVYQIAWQRILALHSGVGAVSIATIVAAYMAGLGLGNLAGGYLSRRLAPASALVLYALLELGVGAFGLASGWIYHDLLARVEPFSYQSAWRTAVVHFTALLPPTLMMGMTFPVLVRALVRAPATASRTISQLYGLNVLGAAIGAALTPWVLIPALGGLVPAIRAGAALNLLVGFGVLAVGRAFGPTPVDADPAASPRLAGAGPPASRVPFPVWLVLYALSGAWALALEVVWFRMIDVAVKATAFTFGTVVAIYLGGLALGSLLGARTVTRSRDPLGRFLACQCVILIYVALTVLFLADAPTGLRGYRWLFAYWGTYEPLDPAFDAGWKLALLYGVLPLTLFGPPTVLMGYAFAVLQSAVQDSRQTSGYKVGVLQAANILGCVAGSLVVGLLLFPRLGTAVTLRALVGFGSGFAALGVVLAERRRRFVALGLTLALLAVLLPDQGRFWGRLHGWTGPAPLVEEDETGVLALTPESEDRWRLSINGKGQSFLPYGGIHSRLGALAAVIHPRPTAIAIIGLGSGDTAWAAACRPETRSVRVFEICAGQVDLLRRLGSRAILPHLDHLLRDDRIAIEAADGRHALAHGGRTYDVIEADAIRPNGAYSGNLYSLEFYRLCASRLKPGGLMCSWAPTPRSTVTFRRVFPHVVNLDGGEILVGSLSPIAFDTDAWRARLSSPAVASYLGPEVQADCLQSLERAHPVTTVPYAGFSLNRDLAPRDEYRGR